MGNTINTPLQWNGNGSLPDQIERRQQAMANVERLRNSSVKSHFHQDVTLTIKPSIPPDTKTTATTSVITSSQNQNNINNSNLSVIPQLSNLFSSQFTVLNFHSNAAFVSNSPEANLRNLLLQHLLTTSTASQLPSPSLTATPLNSSVDASQFNSNKINSTSTLKSNLTTNCYNIYNNNNDDTLGAVENVASSLYTSVSSLTSAPPESISSGCQLNTLLDTTNTNSNSSGCGSHLNHVENHEEKLESSIKVSITDIIIITIRNFYLWFFDLF